MRPLVLAFVLAFALAGAPAAAASEPATTASAPIFASPAPLDATREPVAFRRGAGELGLFADASIASELTLLSAGVRGGYFVRAGLEIAAELQATWLMPPRGVATRATADEPGAAFRLTPLIRWMPLRTDSFAPYLLAGAGPTVLGRAVLGHVLAAPGAFVHLGGRVWLDLAIRFTRGFPGARCRAAFSSQAAPGFCEFQFGPQLGLVAAF